MSIQKQKGQFWATVLSNQQIRSCYYRITLEMESKASFCYENVVPGQFVMLDLTQTALPVEEKIPNNLKDSVKRQLILRRPFSFSDVNISHGISGSIVKLEIMYCVLGPSTVRMSSLSKGDKVNILGPLGNGFQVNQSKKLAILIAGGMGAPPILHLGTYLKLKNPDFRPVVFVGAKDCDSLPFIIRIGNLTGLILEEFKQLNLECHTATDDGSAGFKGYVTQCAEKWLSNNQWRPENTIIYSCGPESMLSAAAKLAERYDIECQVSMERLMACGIGLCQSCAVENKIESSEETEYKLCCKEGPVFDSRSVVFRKEG